MSRVRVRERRIGGRVESFGKVWVLFGERVAVACRDILSVRRVVRVARIGERRRRRRRGVKRVGGIFGRWGVGGDGFVPGGVV